MIQCFNHNSFRSSFSETTIPQLVYSCKTESHHAALPRVLHMHPDKLEIVFIVSGKGVHFIGGTTYHTQKGDLLIYNANTLHDEIAAPSETLNVYCIAVNHLQLPELPPNHLVPETKKAVFATEQQFDSFLSLFELIHQSIVEQGAHIGEINNYLTRAVLSKIIALTEEEPYMVESEEAVVGRQIKEYIDQHYMEEDINLNMIAQALHMSQFYIAHLFKEITNSSPMQYVIRRRIGEAQSLLINTNQSVTDIALLVGYRNSNHFHSAFQKIVGLTPRNYRKYWIAAYRHDK